MKPNIHTFPTQTVATDSAQMLAAALKNNLTSGKKILLLLSGGSAIKMYKEMFDKIIAEGMSAPNLTVSMFDERFVEKGHADSNEQQLKETGVLAQLEKIGASWVPYVSESMSDGETQAVVLSKTFADLLAKIDQVIIFAGMGDDGHTAGLLPVRAESPNKSKLFETSQLIAYYEVDPLDSNNPQLKRLTATPELIKHADQVYLYAIGAGKKTALEKLIANAEPEYAAPVLCLLRAKNPVEIFTDIEI